MKDLFAMFGFTPDVVRWSELSPEERGFAWLEENYGPLPRTHLESIAKVELEDRRRLIAWLDRLLPWESADRLGFPLCERLRLPDESWNTDAGVESVRQWLYGRSVPYGTTIYAFYDRRQALRMPWRLLVKYWDAFAWSVGDSMIATDSTGQWACVFHHENVIEFGRYGRTEPLVNNGYAI
ncbi:hypothetical protein [Alienimonas sp. DA493]|uniref:hypothetical protein n=1 Tax=Alienimonas sp. DA493 TaxID=3373605 RepID=UPI0037542EBA